MNTPLPVWVALGGSIILSAAGLAEFVGVWSAFGSGAPAVAGAALAACLLIVAGGEVTKSRMLQASRAARDGSDKREAKYAFFALAALAVVLSHEGQILGQRLLLSPEIARLDAAVTDAARDLDAADSAERLAAQGEDARAAPIVAAIDRQPDTWAGRRERERLGKSLDDLTAGRAERLRDESDATAQARANLETARRARANAPKGFASFAIALPFGLGLFAPLPWIIAIALEYLTGGAGRLLAPARREPDRVTTWEDVLTIDPESADLITDAARADALASWLAKAQGKLSGVRRKLKAAA